MKERFAEKIYIGVLAVTQPDGSIVPLRLIWPDGRNWEIDRVLDVRPAASLKAGGAGIRYTCRIRNHQTYLFQEENKWFVEAKQPC